MRKGMWVGMAVLAGSAVVAFAGPKEDVQSAAKKLAAADNYTWTSHVEGGFGGDTTGQTQKKDELTHISMTFGDNTVEVFKEGEKVAVKTEDGWKSAEEAAQGDNNGQPNPARFIGNMMRNYKTPAQQAEEVASKIPDLKEADGAITGDLSEQIAKDMMAFRGRRGGNNNNGPQISNAKGSVKFWLKDGAITKMEINVQGTINFNGDDRDINRTTTVEIKDVGSTKVDVPADAKAKLK